MLFVNCHTNLAVQSLWVKCGVSLFDNSFQFIILFPASLSFSFLFHFLSFIFHYIMFCSLHQLREKLHNKPTDAIQYTK